MQRATARPRDRDGVHPQEDGPRQARGRFGDFIANARRGRSREEVARRVGKSGAWLRWIEMGRAYLTTKEVELLARALDLSPQDVFRRAREAGY